MANKVLERLDELCSNKGWSYYELALASDMAANVLYNMRSRDSIPTIPILEKLCIGLGITVEQFFSGFNDGMDDSQKTILNEWITLTEEEKTSILGLINLYKNLKNR